MEGLLELLIIAAIFLFPALEAWAKKRRRKRGRGEEGEAGASDGEAWSTPEDSASTGSRSDESAEVLLPEDLWEELTGQKRRRDETPGPATAGGGPAEGGTASQKAEDWTAPDRELESASRPTANGREWERWEDWDEEEPASLGTDAASPSGGGREGAADEATPEGLGTEVGGFPEPTEPRRADVLEEIGAGGARASSRRRTADLGRLRPGRIARRGGPPAHARDPHPLVGELDRDALRRAVVYAEILGPPVSMREG